MLNSLPAQKNFNKGQAILAILLVMSVILVIGLSIASRSVTDIKISQQSQEAARALWVAQAGLEEAIKSNRTIAAGEGKNLSGVKYLVTKSNLVSSGGEFTFQNVGEDEPVTLWLVNHDDATGLISSGGYTGASLTLFWGNSGSSPALEATLIYKDASNNYYSRRYAYDPQTRSTPTNFTSVSSGSFTCGGQSFSYSSGSVTLPLAAANTNYFVRMKLLFNTLSQPICVKAGSGDFPQQGSCFESSATVGESGVTRKLSQCKFWDITSPVFDFVLFSGGNIQ